MISVYVCKCDSKKRFPFNLFGLLIKWIGGTGYSHFAIRIDRPNGRSIYLDATISNVAFYSEAEFLKRYKVEQYKKVILETNYQGFMDWAFEYVGRRYSPMQAVGLLFVIIGSASNPFSDGEKGLICNELVLRMLVRFKGVKINRLESLDLKDTENVLAEYEAG